MAKKKAAGRPKEAEPLMSIASVKGTKAFEAWIDGLVERTGSRTRINLLWKALKECAAGNGYDKPMPNR